MTEKPNSVCKRCGAGIDCTTHAIWRPELTGTHPFEPVAEPAEPSASPRGMPPQAEAPHIQEK
jgi:hypothetical protein